LNKKSSILSGSRRDSVNMNLTRSSQDYNALVDQNNELNDALVIMQDEVTYLKLREKKIMYLVHLMQGKGYPIT
jgi:Cdc6-like AAA superfamily ATPase